MEGEAGDGPDARAHEPFVKLDGVERRAAQVVDADALVHRAAATYTHTSTLAADSKDVFVL